MEQILKEKSKSNSIKLKSPQSDSYDIGVLGSGVVGAATGLGFGSLKNKVIFLDIDPNVIKSLKKQKQTAIEIEDYQNQQIKFLFVCIGTPSSPQGIDLTAIKESMSTVGKIVANQKKHIIIIIRSTIIPGTTESILLPLIEKSSGKAQGDGWSLTYQPEFLRAHSHKDDFLTPWLTIVGTIDSDKKVINSLKKLFSPFQKRIHFLNIKEAEFAKYVNNLKLSTLISFSNEIWLLGNHFEIEANHIQKIVSEFYEPSWNPLYGSTGGYPFGGTCFPKDTTAMLIHANNSNLELPLLEGVIKVNKILMELSKKNLANPPKIKGINWKAAPGKKKKKN